MIDVTPEQRSKLEHLESLARDLNRRLNLYSAASAEDFQRRHIAHALFLASKRFPAGAQVVDWGTGGGIPGLPLAILFPDVQFVLIDVIEKKIRAVRTMARRLGLSNVQTWSGRAEAWDGSRTHSVSRATSSLSVLWSWHLGDSSASAMRDVEKADCWKPGLVCLKGGELASEIDEVLCDDKDLVVESTPLTDLTSDPYFATKAIVQVSQHQR